MPSLYGRYSATDSAFISAEHRLGSAIYRLGSLKADAGTLPRVQSNVAWPKLPTNNRQPLGHCWDGQLQSLQREPRRHATPVLNVRTVSNFDRLSAEKLGWHSRPRK